MPSLFCCIVDLDEIIAEMRRRPAICEMTLQVDRRRASVLDACGQAGRVMFYDEKRAHGGRMRTYIHSATFPLG